MGCRQSCCPLCVCFLFYLAEGLSGKERSSRRKDSGRLRKLLEAFMLLWDVSESGTPQVLPKYVCICRHLTFCTLSPLLIVKTSSPRLSSFRHVWSIRKAHRPHPFHLSKPCERVCLPNVTRKCALSCGQAPDRVNRVCNDV